MGGGEGSRAGERAQVGAAVQAGGRGGVAAKVSVSAGRGAPIARDALPPGGGAGRGGPEGVRPLPPAAETETRSASRPERPASQGCFPGKPQPLHDNWAVIRRRF